ncbi:hybrid sensor histidine kinase/response regulator [Crassaminicella thermophila]|uniref:Stage 0 sporulation protein A homolog n=1 Tax=Crassaminicella thermophila TaxID=2599308 RepID=A0A5C0SG85_CRATE|nr:hybrid sensor histidine kinase/response regulator [Crassaminicella thermophila]QEK12394.1 hybrid sensor histidine kinase/response regulator [Crassaminicella thermophila]
MDNSIKPKILIADDSMLNLRIIEDVIKNNGYEPVLVTSGNEVIEYVKKERPDLILLDIVMPGMDGYETCQILKNDSKIKDIPIIFLTSQSRIEDIAKGFEVGAVDYINKPFHEVELISRVKTHLQLKNLHDELKKSNEQLKKTNEELLKANETIQYNKLQTEFFANISHEFKTPLNLIFSTIQLFELCKQNYMDKHIKIMKQNCYRLLRLVNNLIDITKIDSGYFEIDLQNHNIVHIVETISLSILEYIKRNELNLIFDTEVEEKIIACDADKIERIILNLLSNSIKFTKPGGSIVVKIYDKKEKVVISIKDNGKGIPKDKIDTIFERFMQIDKSLSRKKEGSGIGLSLVKALVEMHGGKISVKSEYGKGSEFIIEIPAKVLPESDIKIDNNYSKEDHIESINIEFSDIYSVS